MAWLLPECVISRFFKEMCNIQRARRVVKNPLEDGQVGRVAFFVSMSHVFKRSKVEKGQIFYHLTADVDQVVTSLGAARRAGPFFHGASNAGSAGCLGLL